MTHKLEEVAKIWKDVYIACISKIPDEDVRREVMPEAILDGGLSQPAPLRVWCARLVGAVAPRLDAKRFLYTCFNNQRIEQQLFPKASQLCQDTDYEVRKAMSKEMGSLIKAMGIKLAKKTVLPEFLELLNDEEGSVQEAALRSLMDFAEILDIETRMTTLIPSWKKICASNNPKLVLITAELFGSFMWRAKSLNRSL